MAVGLSRRTGGRATRAGRAALALAACMALAAAPASARDGTPDAAGGLGDVTPSQRGPLGPTASYLIALAQQPLAAVASRVSHRDAGGAAGAHDVAGHRTRLTAEQDHAVRQIAVLAPGARVERRLEVAWNGLEVTATPADAARLRSRGFDMRPNPRVEAFLNKSVGQTRADRVWSRVDANGLPLTGTGIDIAILDTGVDYFHADLGGCFGGTCKVSGGWDVVNGDGDPQDDHGHGTHVASIAAGNGTYKGVAPDASIRAYKVLGSNASGLTSHVLEGIDRALDPNRDGDLRDRAEVINISLGCTDWGACSPEDALSTAATNAVAAGSVVVAAAGNSGWVGVASPASARSTIAVGASNGEANTADFSAEGPASWGDRLIGKPDLVAPGVEICAARYASSSPSTVCNSRGRHVRMTGTSMAAPHVAGAAALLLQQTPALAPAQVKALLRATARPIPELNNSGTNLGAGLLDVSAAVGASTPGAPTVELEPISATSWPRAVRASVQAAGVTGWRLEHAGLHSPTWSTVAAGTTLPADGVFHVFTVPVYDSMGPRLRLIVETASTGRAVDYSWIPQHSDFVTSPLAASATGGVHNGWSNGARATASDDQHAEAVDDPSKAFIAVDYSIDAGATWSPVTEELVLPVGADGRVNAGVATSKGPFTPDGFRVRLRSATGLLLQDFGPFPLVLPAGARVTNVLVYVEGHTRQTSDPVAGQSLTALRRVDDVAVRLRYRMDTTTSGTVTSAAFTRVDEAIACQLGCQSEPQVAVRSDGRPVIAYRDISKDALKLMVCGDLECRAGNTYTLIDGAPGCPEGCGPQRNGFPSVSLSLRADDRPVLAYVSNDAPTNPYSRELRLVSCGNATCTNGNTYTRFDISKYEPTPPPNCILIVCEPGTPLPARTEVGTVTLRLTGAGVPLLAFAARVPDGTDTAVRFLTCATTDCQGSVTVSTIEGPGCTGMCDARSEVVWPISMSLRPDGRPVLSYQQQYVWASNGVVTSIGRIKLVTCGDARCSASNTMTIVTPHTGYAPSVRLQDSGVPILTFLSGSVPKPLLVTCRTATCAGPPGDDQLYAATALDGWGACAPGCNTRASFGFLQATALHSGTGAPVLAVHDQRSGSLKIIRCGDTQCAAGTTYTQIDGSPGCPTGCDPTAYTGAYPALARRASDGALVVAYRDFTGSALKVAVVKLS